MLLPSIFGENLFDDWFDDWSDFDRMNQMVRQDEKKLYGRRGKNLMKTDVKETKSGYEIDVDLPGFKKEDVSLQLENGYLTISTEKALENKEEQKGRVLRQERYAGTMSRSFYVGSYVTEEDIKAKYENGVLSLSIPKKEAPKAPEKKTICIEG